MRNWNRFPKEAIVLVVPDQQSSNKDTEEVGALLKFVRSIFYAPLVVTVAGGFLAGGIATYWQQTAADLAYYRERWAEDVKVRREAAQEFANQIETSIFTAQLIKRSEIWLRTPDVYYVTLKGTKEHRFRDGRTFQEERDYYETTARQFYSGRTPDGLIAGATTVFTSKDVLDRLAELQNTMDKFMLSRTEPVLMNLKNKANKEYFAVISAMHHEINSINMENPGDKK